MLKNTLLTIMLGTVLVFQANAQQNRDGNANSYFQNINQVFNSLDSLNEVQKIALGDLLEKMEVKSQEIRNKNHQDREAHRNLMTKLKTEFDAETKKILNSKQYEQFTDEKNKLSRSDKTRQGFDR